MAYRQRPPQNGVKGAEDQGIGTDADGEQCDRNQREAGILREHPHGKAKVAHVLRSPGSDEDARMRAAGLVNERRIRRFRQRS